MGVSLNFEGETEESQQGSDMIYKFSYSEGNFQMSIEASKQKVMSLLNKYRKKDQEYSCEGWLKFLKDRGIKAKLIKPKANIRF